MNKFKSTDPLPVCDEQHEHQDIEAIKKTLPEDDRFIEASDLFSLLSDSTRLKSYGCSAIMKPASATSLPPST